MLIGIMIHSTYHHRIDKIYCIYFVIVGRYPNFTCWQIDIFHNYNLRTMYHYLSIEYIFNFLSGPLN